MKLNLNLNSFNEKIGAYALVGSAAVYLVLSLAMGRNAVSAPPPDLSAKELGLDIWKTSALLINEKGRVAVVDTRPAEEFAYYALPGSKSAPGASAANLVAEANGNTLLIVAKTEAEASKLAGEVKAAGHPKVHFLTEGVRAWYLTYEVPTPVFNDKAPPPGWAEAMKTVKSFLEGQPIPAEQATASVGKLVQAAYVPTELQGKKKAAGGAKKSKISGGCGG